ncbi:RNA-directed DNA polymerase, eukaryota, reverse transcriptase zinc-binding domain protein [Tanacetum coccineum]
MVYNESGDCFKGNQVAEQFVIHFQKFFGQEVAVQSLNLDVFKSLKRISTEDADHMTRSVTDAEIKNAMFDICDNKAPGPDGYTAKFYKKAWNKVGRDVCDAIRELFTNGKMLGEMNSTLITLVPKISTPTKVFDYRPIACCNVIYKTISKIITDRIKTALNKIVNPNQSAFILGRQITDNILLTQELLNGYDRKNGAKRVAMKVDIQKAYDTVNWSFLESTLVLFAFPTKMITWIMVCVKTIGFSVCVNGESCDTSRGRGLRQGDPMSPYIFTMVMEVFTLILQKHIKDFKKFKYHWGCKKLGISHLCFVDDLLVLSHGDLESIMVIKKAMDLFSSVSGLNPNIGKNTVFFGNVPENIKQQILHILPFKVGKLLMTYLGVPLITKKIGINDCKCLIDRIKARVNSWKNKLLSYAGRLQLITSVLASMHIYWASAFRLPKAVIKDIDKVLKCYLWCNGEISKGKAKVSWKNVCKPKNEGGLDIKNLGGLE